MVLLLAGPLCDTPTAPCDQKVSEVQILQRDMYDWRVTISQCCLEPDGEYTFVAPGFSYFANVPLIALCSEVASDLARPRWTVLECLRRSTYSTYLVTWIPSPLLEPRGSV